MIEDNFAMEEGEFKLVLRRLSSLMKDENDENWDLEYLNKGRGVISFVFTHFAHASFGDYLFNLQVTRAHFTSIDRNMKTRLLYGALHSLCNRFLR